ncbi:ATP-dependent DNA helicase [Gluconobacter frateurii]|uniref:DNA helicase TraA n=1 Tax=Gluconobacter frateurii NRIC 0228 TaxID=1307946 RepID=A0ABQ0QBJ1_9PROT|nr:AAA family ATPase [Gluconobacter frateurii]GBR12070.1 DNA helicase TraA [Gluconobacter frateurii NRIC 0228]GLP89318.1 deoxyribonuclease [Gluconobacter frateurii]
MVTLTLSQKTALDEIIKAHAEGRPTHLLTGYAGSGKTTLMQEVARHFLRLKIVTVITAPTHKATAVLRAKVDKDVECRTIQSHLGLQPSTQGGQTTLVRAKRPQTIPDGVVIVDECSMISRELMGWIRDLLKYCFVLFVGDPAQLPPVGEEASPSFSVPSRSHLETVVRQAAGNPILEAATVIRQSQGGSVDWSWVQDARQDSSGLFIPKDVESWVRKAFTSDAFDADNDSFRYLCWTNHRVHQVNQMVRRWRYGEHIEMPFMPGERAVARAPFSRQNEDKNRQQIATNEEVLVVDIQASRLSYRFEACGSVAAWSTDIPSWELTVLTMAGEEITAHLVQDERQLQAVERRLVQEARQERKRWQHRFAFQSALLNLQAIYAMTVHTSQGSTFRNVFVDLGDIRRRSGGNPLETQQLCYVALTRATDMVFLVNVGMS